MSHLPVSGRLALGLWCCALASLATAADPAAAPAPANEALTALIARLPPATSPQTLPAMADREAVTRDLVQLIDTGSLKTGDDFYQASKLLLWDSTMFRAARVRYELALAAVALDQAQAEKEIGNRWNEVVSALGRPRRFSQTDRVPDFMPFDLAPAVILRVLRNPAAARTASADAQDSDEVKQLVDADQAPRSQSGPGPAQRSQEEMKKMMAEDRQRQVRMREIITAGELRTATDFARASLVMQHSGDYAGFQLAHELAVCSTLLGDRKRGRWLVAATYDRMLRTIGHDQRFGTQSISIGQGPFVVARVDESGINDAERVALGCPTLEVARNRHR